jgi:hypothetical protein
MIIGYCDICGDKITDESVHKYGNKTLWELTGTVTPIQNAMPAHKTVKYIDMIICDECKGLVINAIYAMIQQLTEEKK